MTVELVVASAFLLVLALVAWATYQIKSSTPASRRPQSTVHGDDTYLLTLGASSPSDCSDSSSAGDGGCGGDGGGGGD